MLSTSQSEQAVEDGVVLEAKPDCVALVPVIPSAQWSQSPGPQWTLPSSIFVTQLIATAEQQPQTRGLRRATLADAQTAYNANQRPRQGAARTRQIIQVQI
jgi:hypothetical protein